MPTKKHTVLNSRRPKVDKVEPHTKMLIFNTQFLTLTTRIMLLSMDAMHGLVDCITPLILPSSQEFHILPQVFMRRLLSNLRLLSLKLMILKKTLFGQAKTVDGICAPQIHLSITRN
jgi:hypothetical protein